MLNLINIFPKKVKSIDDFINILKTKKTKSILIEPQIRTIMHWGFFPSIVGDITDFQYTLKCTTTTLDGKKLIYLGKLFKRFGSTYGFADSEDRRNAAIKLFLFGEQKVKFLQTKIPGMTVNLIGPDYKHMDEAKYEKLHKDALICGVTIDSN